MKKIEDIWLIIMVIIGTVSAICLSTLESNAPQKHNLIFRVIEITEGSSFFFIKKSCNAKQIAEANLSCGCKEVEVEILLRLVSGKCEDQTALDFSSDACFLTDTNCLYHLICNEGKVMLVFF